jgi:glucosylceramidase
MYSRYTNEILITSESGKRLHKLPNITFTQGEATGNVIRISPDKLRQRVLGIGTSFTEASAFVLAHLSARQRHEVMCQLFSAEGANFSLARTPIGSCDFCVEGRYSYADIPDDKALAHFAVTVDKDGFSREDYPGIQDESFDLLPMIQQAQAIKQQQQDKDLRIVASAWTAPAWMKDIEDWYQAPSSENQHQGYGGVLKPQYAGTYADYLIKYLGAYAEQGVSIWGITPVNEPFGNNGQWESMHFTPQSQKAFIKQQLGPRLHQAGLKETKLLVFDQNRDQLEEWADTILPDEACAPYVYGIAVHWYESTNKVYEDIFDRVHEKYPDYAIMHTEGCIDDLGKDAPKGILDPARYKESGWFANDAFWWNDNATDWAYSATWPGINADDHPIYTPVHRYARNIIVSLNHWVSGWIDWNCVLDQHGGPNHVGNYCGAPIMVDTTSLLVYYTPVFYILKQLSQTIRPGDQMVQCESMFDAIAKEHVYACASLNDAGLLSIQLLNTAKTDMPIALQVGQFVADVSLEANSLQTVRVQHN